MVGTGTWKSLILLLCIDNAIKAACPYDQLPALSTAILVADARFCRTSIICVVNRECQEQLKYTKWNAIGSFLDLPGDKTSWIFDGSGAYTDLQLAIFPTHLDKIVLQNMTFPNTTIEPKWPPNLTQLSILYTNMRNIPTNLPSSIAQLNLEANYLYDASELRRTPRSVTKLSLEQNDYSEIENLDWSNLTFVRIGRNSKLRRLSNITWSSRLKYFDLTNLSITSWVLENQTFLTLNNALQPTIIVEDGTSVDDSEMYTGYGYNDLSVKSDPTYCAAQNGTIQELWSDKSLRNSKHSHVTFTVCVLPSIKALEMVKNAGQGAGTIAGIASGALLLVVACYLVWKRQVSNDESKKVFTSIQTPYSPSKENTVFGSRLDGLALVRVADRDVQICDLISTDSSGDLYRGLYDSEAVAVRTLQLSRATRSNIQNLADEILLMSQFDSPYIVYLVGAAWTRHDDLKCIMEYMDGGDLGHYLNLHLPDTFPWIEKYVHILSIVEALCYLHSMNIIHRDLKARNVLLDSTKGTKLSNFGVSNVDLQHKMTTRAGIYRWMAPEVLQDQGYTLAADIYSFGILLSEFDTHHIPYDNMKSPDTGQPLAESVIILKVVSGTLSPTFTVNCPSWIRDLASKCLAYDPQERLKASEVSFIVRKVLREMSEQMFSI